jgi:AcrR family transcriptional regulator
MSQTTEITYSPTAAKILCTARRLFMQRGYRAVSVNDIVQAAEITKPTLYYHFADKEELFVQMALHMLAELRVRMDTALEGKHTTRERLSALAEVTTTADDGDTRMMRHEIREHLGPEQQERIKQAFHREMLAPLREVMRAGLAAGELVGHDPELLAWLFLAVIEGFHRQGAAAPGDDPIAHFSNEMLTDLFLYGVAPRGN